MKTKILYIFTASIILFSSCNDWLKVNSNTQIKDIFESSTGFQDVLTGIYMNMASEEMYGRNMTWEFLDLAGQPYINPNISIYQSYVQSGSYKHIYVDPYINNMWNKSYNTIANINNELKYLDNGVLSEPVRQLYRGELLALRAYIHFDILRMYGYGNLINREKFAEKLTIPYVTKYAKDQTPQLTYAKTIELMITDLNDAIAALANDPIRQGSISQEISSDVYWKNRKVHMNYYAAKATLARVYMWEGSAESLKKAFDIADELVKLENKAYSWVREQSLVGDKPDRIFSSEHLFTINIYNLADIINSSMTDLTFDPSAKTSIFKWSHINYDIFNAYGYDYDKGEYTADGIGFNDYRLGMHYKTTMKNNEQFTMGYKLAQLKYQGEMRVNDMIPLIKISEMYYIIAEYYLSQENSAEALNIINLVRSKRGLAAPLTQDIIDNELYSSVDTELTKEYMREFIGEGQLFFYFKRRAITNPLSLYDPELSDAKWLLPYPTDEVATGNRIQ